MEQLVGQIVLSILGVLFTIEITPIKLSPLAWIGKRMNRDTNDRIDKLEKQFVESECDKKRTEILDFANSCRNGRKHTVEEWEHMIDSLGKYEKFCKEYDIDNDKLPVNAKYLRELYMKLSLDGKFEQKRKTGELLECQ